MARVVIFMGYIVTAILLFFCLHLVVLVSGCTNTKAEEPKAEAPPEFWEPETMLARLEWNNGSADRNLWTKHLTQMVNGPLFETFSKAKDLRKFCPNFESLDKGHQVQVISSIVVAVAYYESGWNPVSRMKEPQGSFPKPDPVTGQPVWSEGLLQLSYQDQRNHSFCKFDWNTDKRLGPSDPRKSILNPINNLNCGVQIMAKQIRLKGTFITEGNYYWSVLSMKNRFGKVPEIIGRVKRFMGSTCQIK
jgi:hypothetical protein